MKRSPSLLRLVVLAMLVAVGVIHPTSLRMGQALLAHLINIVCGAAGSGVSFIAPASASSARA